MGVLEEVKEPEFCHSHSSIFFSYFPSDLNEDRREIPGATISWTWHQFSGCSNNKIWSLSFSFSLCFKENRVQWREHFHNKEQPRKWLKRDLRQIKAQFNFCTITSLYLDESFMWWKTSAYYTRKTQLIAKALRGRGREHIGKTPVTDLRSGSKCLLTQDIRNIEEEKGRVFLPVHDRKNICRGWSVNDKRQ